MMIESELKPNPEYYSHGVFSPIVDCREKILAICRQREVLTITALVLIQ